MDSWISGGMMLVKLGLAVYEAVQKGERTKTVGEIFDGVPRDQETIDRLREDARQHYAAQAATGSPDPDLTVVSMRALRAALGETHKIVMRDGRAVLVALQQTGG